MDVELGAPYSEEFQPASEDRLELQAYETAEESGHLPVHPCEDTAAFDSRHDAVPVYLLYDERHRKHHSRTDFLQCGQQHGRCRRLLNVADTGTAEYRIKHTDAQLVCVRHRQDGKPHILLGTFVGMERGADIGTQIPVAEHHALRISGGAGGIDEGCYVVRLRLTHPPVAGKGRIVPLDDFKGLDVYHEHHLFHAFLAQLRQKTL